jgi:AGCS family alanine or glycine:cation symporter
MTATTTPAGVQAFYDQVTNVSDFIWGGTWNGESILPFPPMVIVLLGVGAWIMIGLRFYPILKLGEAFAGLFKKGEGGKGEISPFAALSTALSGQVGTGNLAGVATAITLGGPGALFWMWVTALFGMALAFAEGSLAIRFREQRADGTYQGGPMTYIRKGLGKNWGWLAVLFCLGTLFSSVATGNMIQSNSIADSITSLVPVPEWGAGLIVAAAVFIVIIGGIKSIGSIAEKIVPFMAITYLVLGLIALVLNIEDLPASFALIFDSAFNGAAATGGFLGAGVMMAIRAGVARGLFSNEAGQGSTPMAHAVAQTDDPARQGRFAMMGTFIDTMIICTMTGLVMLTVQGSFPAGAGTVEHVWNSDLRGFEMTLAAYAVVFPQILFGTTTLGGMITSACLIMFVFTTLLTWSYYGERAATYLFGQRVAIPWRLLWVGMIFVGSFQQIEFVWRMGDIANAAMALPNLIALAALSAVVFALAKGDRTAGKTHD